MIEYFVVLGCFVALIAIRIYLFKVTYDNKLKYFAQPKDLALEFDGNLKSTKTEDEQRIMVDNFDLMAAHNISIIKKTLTISPLTNDELAIISERCRNTSLVIALVQLRFKDHEKEMKKRLRKIGAEVAKQVGTLTETTEKLKKSSKKWDKALKETIEQYIQYINTELSPYFRD